MIEPEAATRWRSQAAFDRTAALLIGLVAVLAGVLAIEQAYAGLGGTHAQVLAGRLAADVSARISAQSLTSSASLSAQQDALVIGMEALSRQLQGTMAGDETAVAIGAARQVAADRLTQVIADSAATVANDPLDAYARDLVRSTDATSIRLVSEQNRQVDLATAAGEREQLAVLGLSLGTLAGVLAGIAAVLGRGRTGWAVLLTGWAVAAGAAVVAALGLG